MRTSAIAPGQFPVAERKAQQIFSLPIYPHLKDEEVDEVIEVVQGGDLMADWEHIDWLRGRLSASLAIEPKDPSELLDWLEARRKEVAFSAELIPLREVAGWHQADNGNISHATGQFFRVEGVRVRSAPGVREVAAWDQPIFTQSEGGIFALLCRETTRQGRRVPASGQGRSRQYRLSAALSHDPEHLGKHSGPERRQTPRLAECLDPSENIRVVYGRSTTRREAGSGRNQTKT